MRVISEAFSLRNMWGTILKNGRDIPVCDVEHLGDFFHNHFFSLLLHS